MKKQLSVLLIAAAVLAAVFVAGCTSQTASPTPSPSGVSSTGTDQTARVVNYLQSQGYTVTKPFSTLVTTPDHDVYSGNIKDNKDNKISYGATMFLFRSSGDASDNFKTFVTNYSQTGWTTLQSTGTKWIGEKSPLGQMTVMLDTNDNAIVTGLVISMTSTSS